VAKKGEEKRAQLAEKGALFCHEGKKIKKAEGLMSNLDRKLCVKEK